MNFLTLASKSNDIKTNTNIKRILEYSIFKIEIFVVLKKLVSVSTNKLVTGEIMPFKRPKVNKLI